MIEDRVDASGIRCIGYKNHKTESGNLSGDLASGVLAEQIFSKNWSMVDFQCSAPLPKRFLDHQFFFDIFAVDQPHY